MKKHLRRLRHLRYHRRLVKEVAVLLISVGIFGAGLLTIWLSSLQLPDLSTFEQRKVSESTGIYDRTGKILLYDVHADIKRTLIPYAEISRNVKNATVAIEDAEFYEHHGVKPTALLRAAIKNLMALDYSQGGSTITQQVIKNSLLTKDKTITRKLKEWVLAIKLEQVTDKETILGIYLNEAPYGGTIYGVEQASEEYFGKHASDLTLAESAYLAALPQAPSFYSPFGQHRDRLEVRKNLVLQRMFENKFVTATELETAKKEVVSFSKPEDRGIKAPHFVFFVKEYLVGKYGESVVAEGGLKVTTTLDYELQQKGEEIVKRYAVDNKKLVDSENAALVAIDPKTGQILTMVGSRDYFDQEIEGNFNVTLAHRQPGSSFKPFVYAEAFVKGYTPDTVLFDLKTEFSSACTPLSVPKNPEADPNDPNSRCYSPRNYDGNFRGPMTLRDALAQSINVVAVKLLYLVGIDDSLNLAKDMGVESLGDGQQYGLTMVLGGGEVTPLEMTSAYGVFANNGIRNPAVSILKVENKSGTVLEEFRAKPIPVLDPNIALTVSDVLSDNKARAPIFGSNSALYFPGRDVAAKTGTTNDYKDTWILGYTPSIVVGAWAGNNDGRPIQKEQSARLVVAPMWASFMQEAFKKTPNEKFEKPAPVDTANLKPAIKGLWQGGKSYTIDKVSGKLATEYTPKEYREERVVQEVHSILHWINKADPLGPAPLHPEEDQQYENWELPIQEWAKQNGYINQTDQVIPTAYDDVHKPEFSPKVEIILPMANVVYDGRIPISTSLRYSGRYSVNKADFYLNSTYLGSVEQAPFSLYFVPKENTAVQKENVLRVVLTDSVGNKGEASVAFSLTNISE